MTITIDGVYEGGVVRIGSALDLREGTPVRIVVTPLDDAEGDPLAGVIGSCPTAGSAGMADQHDTILYGQAGGERAS
jgi:predicted DNA-binding antitoxin AbrB/MazE fold protein